MKKVGEGTNAVKYSGYFAASNAVMILKREVNRPGRTEGCSSDQQTNKKKTRPP